MPDYRRRKAEAEAQRKAAIASRAPVLGKWLWILFWLVIPSTIAGVMTNENVVEWLPAIYIPGRIFEAIISVSYGVILLKLASQEDRYRTAGICALVAEAIDIPSLFFTGESVGTVLLAIPIAILSLVSTYNEFKGHSAVLMGIDAELSEKWEELWKWHVGLLCVLIGSILLLLIIAILGALGVLAGAIGVLVISIVKLVYLYRTAKTFREYPVSV